MMFSLLLASLLMQMHSYKASLLEQAWLLLSELHLHTSLLLNPCLTFRMEL
jgi:hypothetical protein